jgi:CDGSH-type Zn-finger protein
MELFKLKPQSVDLKNINLELHEPATPQEILDAAQEIEMAEMVRRSNEPGAKFVPADEAMAKLEAAWREQNKGKTFFERTAEVRRKDTLSPLCRVYICQCGEELSENKKYCGECGAKLIFPKEEER